MSESSPFEKRAVLDALGAPLDRKLTAQRDAFDGKGTKLTYLEGHAAIAQLNRLFGYDGWGYSLDAQGVDEWTDGPVEDWYAQFWAVVTLTVRGAPPRQDVGASEVQNRKYTDKRTGEVKVNNNVRKVDARSTARKGAVTDALKRAARTFGQQMGNGLYDTDNDVYAWMVTHGVDDKDADLAAEYRDWQREQDQAPPVPDDADIKRRLAVEIQDLCAGRALEVPASYQDWSELGASLGLPAITGKAQMSAEWLERVKTRLEMQADDDKPIGHSTEFTRVRDALAAATTGADIVRLLDEDLDLHAVSRDEYEELERLAKARHDALAPEPAGAVGSAR